MDEPLDAGEARVAVLLGEQQPAAPRRLRAVRIQYVNYMCIIE